MTKHMVLINQQTETMTDQRLRPSAQKPAGQLPVTVLQNHLGNAAVQRLLAQRSGDGAFDLDDATTARINRARTGGQVLNNAVQTQMSQSLNADFSSVRVHTGSEAHQLNEQLNAKAFTTGQDVFFREGEYNPSSSSGQELLAHELTHVVQQSSGVVPTGGSKMQVNAPDDHFEQEANSVAKQVPTVNSAAYRPVSNVQREELSVSELQAKQIQREAVTDDELGQLPELPKEEDAMAQRQEMKEDDLLEIS